MTPVLTSGGLRRLCSSCSTAASSLFSPAKPAVLLRDFIHDSLYNPLGGYFCGRQSTPVGSLPQPLDFSLLRTQAAYEKLLQTLYTRMQVSWLTPVEIFQPHYGRAVARFILEAHNPSCPLTIYEVGAGTGTLARDILVFFESASDLDLLHLQRKNFLRESLPAVYKQTSYTSIEISPTLALLQHDKVSGAAGHGNRFSVRQHNASCINAWPQQREEHCFVLMFEVLDNLPHDRVWRQQPGYQWHETVVQSSGYATTHDKPAPPMQFLQPLSDPVIERCLSVGGWAEHVPRWHSWVDAVVGERDETLFLPTQCLLLLEAVHSALPNHTLVAADFDALPDVVIPGANAPLVATTAPNGTIDHASYLVPRGSADIFFPTNFAQLVQLYKFSANVPRAAVACSVQASHRKSRAWMEAYADVAATQLLSGYNPLLEEFPNTSFFIGMRSA